MPRPAAPLARELCAVYLLLIIYATLHPITSWRGAAMPPWAWLAHWPAITLPSDVVFNLLAYVPLGALLVWAARPKLRGPGAVLAAACAGALLSLLLESLQTYLPSRTPSMVDLAANAAGALLGAAIAPLLLPVLEGDLLQRIGEAWLQPGRSAARALILTGLWLFALLFPESLLFGHGNALTYFGGPLSGYPFTPAEFARVETAVTGSSLFAAGVMLLCALSPKAPRVVALTLLLAVACALRALSQAILFGTESAWAWLTPGAFRGLLAGAVALLVTLGLTPTMRLALLMIAVTFATVVVNIAPANPYYIAIVQGLNPGRFLDFNGLTQLVAAAWPFFALFYAVLALAEGGQRQA
ncbi:MAG TPA: VanZ family protein [Burkholderiales bacterium]|nr:VanZ family protein [Burkholderiales bacterium]